MLGPYLKKYFEENNISQKEVVIKTNISQSKLSLSLNNKRKFTGDELITIAVIFDIDLNKLKEIKH